jgi:hypothetical protein
MAVTYALYEIAMDRVRGLKGFRIIRGEEGAEAGGREGG